MAAMGLSDDEEDEEPAAPQINMPMPPALGGIGSDDEGEPAPQISSAVLNMVMPPTLGGIGSDDEDEAPGPLPPSGKEPAPAVDPLNKTGFVLSQSGAFKTADFQLRPDSGLLDLSIGEDAPAEHAHPAELGEVQQAPTVEVHSIGELEMLGELGHGASATVFKARHVSSGATVAVKCVTILEKAKRDQVVSELRIMRKHTLGARWLVAMHNAFYEDAKVYTVLEFMGGGSVEDLIKRHASGPTPGLRDEWELCKISKQLLEGLNYLHRQLHQVHRDLKPGNVMLTAAGDVKISDFGISSQLADTGAMCETFVGTTCYMSPERLSGDVYSYSADIWAFGMIVLELASGKYPYPEPKSLFQLLGDIMDLPAPTPPDGLSSELGDFVGNCLRKEPQTRLGAKDLLKHPWLKQRPPIDRSSSLDRESSRHDRTLNSPFERSRSNLGSFDASTMLADLKIGD